MDPQPYSVLIRWKLLLLNIGVPASESRGFIEMVSRLSSVHLFKGHTTWSFVLAWRCSIFHACGRNLNFLFNWWLWLLRLWRDFYGLILLNLWIPLPIVRRCRSDPLRLRSRFSTWWSTSYADLLRETLARRSNILTDVSIEYRSLVFNLLLLLICIIRLLFAFHLWNI